MIGPFTFQGTYDSDGSVQLVKHYRRHNVQYKGTMTAKERFSVSGQSHVIAADIFSRIQ